MFYLVRHGEPDYSERNSKIYQGFGMNMCPLTEKGREQIKNTAKDPRLKDAYGRFKQIENYSLIWRCKVVI